MPVAMTHHIGEDRSSKITCLIPSRDASGRLRPLTSNPDLVTCPECLERLDPPVPDDLIHFTTPVLLRWQESACRLDSRTNQVSARPEDVTCPECRTSPPFLTRHGGQGDDTLVSHSHMHFASAGARLTACGASVAASNSRWLTDNAKAVTCPDCLYGMAPELEPVTETAGRPAVNLPPYYERFKHEWNMVEGPAHEHDCDNCAYLGTYAYHPYKIDLYWCGQGGRPTPIARRGDLGEYTSGAGFIDRDVYLALAYVRALKAGLLGPGEGIGEGL